MSSFIKRFRNSTVMVAFNRTIHFLPVDDNPWSFEIGTELTTFEKGRPRKYFDADSDSDEEQQEKKPDDDGDGTGKNGGGKKDEENAIVALDVNEDRLAVATGDKSLYLLEVDGRSLKVLSRRLLSRASSCVKFAAGGRFAIVCDKGGDCFKYDCEEYRKPGRWLLGHMSQVLDVLIDAEEKLIITSDRDEKIRVTSHPDCHNIETFCLGHTEFVSHLEFLGSECLLSLSGDKTLRWWNYTNGKELARKELDLPGNKLALQNLAADGTRLLAVLCYKPTTINVYKMSGTTDCEFVQSLNLKSEQVFSTIAFDESGNLLGLIIDESTGVPALTKYEYNRENAQLEKEGAIAKTFDDFKLPYVDSVSFLFKKKFDNIKDYQERKRKRIEENSKQLG
uniref:Putative wd repeat protein 4 n=1 Tax=Culex tarsalis TaxID=7177 RepID=A0A1Q3F187_CULTA